MSEEIREAALAAYWRFFESFNTREGDKFADSLHFPHLRVSARGSTPRIVPNPEQHSQGATWERMLASGWDHTVGAEPEVLHLSPDKVHIKGGWTRYTKVLLTPHASSRGKGTGDRWVELFLRNLGAYLRNDPLRKEVGLSFVK